MDISERTRAEARGPDLQEELRDQSTHDALTGLYNRRFLEESFRRELLLAERTGHPVSVIMGDLDHFKAVNDRGGHLAGDEVLRVFGSQMKHNRVQATSLAAMVAEEFLLVLPGLTKRSHRARRTVAAHDGSHTRQLRHIADHGHASFGVASFPRHGRTTDELIAAADSALYSAKSGGRNRVSLCSEPRKEGGRFSSDWRTRYRLIPQVPRVMTPPTPTASPAHPEPCNELSSCGLLPWRPTFGHQR